jgi:hypothetical protein
MTRAATSGTAVERLALDLVGPSTGVELTNELIGWLAGSRRFRAFAETHRDKIRKKLRGATEPEARRDVRAELAVAHLLLEDRRIELAFEAYGSGNPGPDYTMSFRGERSFNLEVTRPRRGMDRAGVATTIAAKLRQLPPSVANALLIAIEGDGACALDVEAAVLELRERADLNDDGYFSRHGLGGTREFGLRLRRLGAVVVWCEAANGEARARSWTNASARIAVPGRALRACVACLRAG